MSVSNSVANWLVRKVINQIPGAIDDLQDREAPEVDAFAAAVNDGATLKEAIRAYVEATPGLTDDEKFTKYVEVYGTVTHYLVEIIELISVDPLLDVIDEHLGDIDIPDWDDNPDNNISAAEFLRRVFLALEN